MNPFRFMLAVSLAWGALSAPAQPAPPPVTSAPVFVPDTSHQNDPLPDGLIAFDATFKTADLEEGTDFAHFTFSFTNISDSVVAVLAAPTSCHCTTVDLPPLPWLLPAGTNGQLQVKVDLAAKTGVIFKSITFTTDKGKRDLMLRVNLRTPPPAAMTENDKAAGIAAAIVDRQAIFKGDCASCHLKNVEGRYGLDLYKHACAICHDAQPRATMVPDLAHLNLPTNQEFWQTWITYGKPGSLMPAWAQSQGGPLNDLQIATLAQYLNTTYPGNVTNAPAK